jgi:predicted Rossmann-fold nucleotide-binding protein
VYGGGSSGIMGVVSGEVLLNGGKVVGVLPRDMVASGEGKEADNSKLVFLNEVGREKVLLFSSLNNHHLLKLLLFIGGNCMCFLR